MAEPIRLVIWDLDETFWKGTLSEGGIREYVQDHHNLVIELARRGIMSSICSKNDFEPVKELLQTRGLWDYFIFPSIDWSPKGARIESIVEAVQLRAPTILFIDDNHANRGEAQAAVPGIEVADETIIATIRDNPLFRGKKDENLSRLKQYKLLEEKAVSKAHFAGDNRKFLQQCGIKVRIESELDDKLDRVVELVNRTNQLNFTKRRLPDDMDEAKRLIAGALNQFDTRAGLIEVEDRYERYGYCGFFMLSGYWGTPYVWQFAFSCRVLGMGVEQWVYDVLGRPKFEIVGDVLSKLDFTPDWINKANDDDARSEATRALPEVRIRGGCELEILEHFFKADAKSTKSEVISVRGRHVVMPNHSSLLAHATRPLAPEQIASIQAIGLDPADFRSGFLEECPAGSILVFSPSADAFYPVYQHNANGLKTPVNVLHFGDPGGKGVEVVDFYFNSQNLDEDERSSFAHMKDALDSQFTRDTDHWDTILTDDYRAILTHAPRDSLLVVLLPNHLMVKDGQRQENENQVKLNHLFKTCAGPMSNVVFIDMCELVDPAMEVVDTFVHYHRNVYYRLFQRICAEYHAWRDRTALAPRALPDNAVAPLERGGHEGGRMQPLAIDLANMFKDPPVTAASVVKKIFDLRSHVQQFRRLYENDVSRGSGAISKH